MFKTKKNKYILDGDLVIYKKYKRKKIIKQVINKSRLNNKKQTILYQLNPLIIHKLNKKKNQEKIRILSNKLIYQMIKKLILIFYSIIKKITLVEDKEHCRYSKC